MIHVGVENTPSPQANLSLNESNASFIRFLVGEKSMKPHGNGTNRTIEKPHHLSSTIQQATSLLTTLFRNMAGKSQFCKTVDGESSQLAMYGC